MDTLTLLLLEVLLGLLGLYVLRRQSPLSLPALAVGTTILVASFYPFATLFIEPRSWRNLKDLSEEAHLTSLQNYVAFTAGLVFAIVALGLLWPRSLRTPDVPPTAARRVRFRDAFVSGGCLVFGAGLYLEYIRRVGLSTLMSTHDFAEKYLASEGMGALLIGLNVMILACLWAEAGQVGKLTRWVFRAVAAGIVVWALFFIAVRTYAVAIALGYVAVYCRDRRFRVQDVRLRLVALMLLGLLTMEGFAILRSSWNSTGDLGSAVELASRSDTDVLLGGVVGGSEFSHPYLTMAEVAQFEEPGALWGSSYVDAVLAFVPLALWPDRPETLAQGFVREYYPSMADRGGGSAFSFVGEAWLNFGNIVGPLLAGIALGLFAVICQGRSLRIPHGWTARVLPYMGFLVLIFHRSQLQATFKQAVSVFLPAVGLALAAEVLWRVFLLPRREREGPRRSVQPLAPRRVQTEAP